MLESFLQRLAAEVGKGLSPLDVAALVAEARDHLGESIQARLELGASIEEAERNAVAAFGAARDMAQSVVREAAVPRGRARGRLLATAYALFIVGIVVGPDFMPWSEALYHAIFVLGWLAVALFAAASFLSRRPTPVRVFATGLAAAVALWVALGATWLNLYPYGGTGMTPRWQAARLLDQSRRERDDHRDHASGDAARAAQELEALPAAQADPVGNFLSFAPEALTASAGAAAAGSAIDLGFGGLGALVFALRRRSRGGGIRA